MPSNFLNRFFNDFSNLIEGEEILEIRKKHMWLHITTFIKIVVQLFIPFIMVVVGIIFFNDFSNFLGKTIFTPIMIVFSTIVLIVFALKIWKLIIDYKYDNLIITNKRIVEVDQNFLFKHRIDSIYIKDVINMAAERNGFWCTILNYGKLDIKTSAEVKDFIVTFIPNPSEIIQIIQNQQQILRNQRYDQPNHPYNQTQHNTSPPQSINTKVTVPNVNIFSDENYKKIMRSKIVQEVKSLLNNS